MQLGPVDWPLVYTEAAYAAFDKLNEQSLGDVPMSDAVQAAAIEYLWHWTGRVYGTRLVSVELCLTGCAPSPGSAWLTPYRSAFGAFPVCGKDCDCGQDCTMARLPWPIHRVESVTFDDEEVDGFEVINRRFVKLTDGTWPQCGDGKKVRVSYERGTPVPYGGQVAAGLLALEMAKALIQDATCQLPRRVQSISRQGIEIAMLDTFDELEKGKTGIWLVDSWVLSVTGPRRGGAVRSPDRKPPGRVRSIL